MSTAAREIPYGALDRLLHRIAFASLDMQRSLGEVENRICASRFDLDHSRRPVFVTSLPRAGTTVMLEALASLPEFAAATYRQMPFTLAPLLWGDLSRRFRRQGEKAERAHGDGVEVDFDSPEAFEETLWMAFWPEHYGRNEIRIWPGDATKDEFESFFRTHMAKIVAAKGGPARRYLSKNNANVARLRLLERLFPDAVLVVPVRNPSAQAISLHRQHLRFRDLHAREPFARRYMEGIGHLEFGEALRPIAFTGRAPDPAEADRPAFWLRYWIDAYDAVLRDAGSRTVFVDHDALSARPGEALGPLGEALGVSDPDMLLAQAARFRPPRPAEPPDAPARLLERAGALHDELRRRCLRGSDARTLSDGQSV